LPGSVVLLVEDRPLLNVDIVRRLLTLGNTDEVANLALEADVGDDALAGFWIYPRQVARIWIPVGVPIGDVKEVYEVVPMRDRIRVAVMHWPSPS
jgi:hypothetical protein